MCFLFFCVQIVVFLFSNAHDIMDIVEVRLGRLVADNGMLRPLPHAGFVRVWRDVNEGLAFFVWLPRIEGTSLIEGSGEEWLIAPGEANFVPVPQCPGRRAFALRFNNTKVRHFFWLQELDDESYGDDFVKRVNAILDGSADQSLGQNVKCSSLAQSDGCKLDSHRNAKSEDLIQKGEMKHMAGVGSQNDASSDISTPETQNQVSVDAQGTPRRSARIAASVTSPPKMSLPFKSQRTRRTSFAELLNADSLADVLADPLLLEELCVHLPPGRPHNSAELVATVRSPQFQQTLSFMDEIISAGDMAALASELGVDASVLSAGCDASDLFNALQGRRSP